MKTKNKKQKTYWNFRVVTKLFKYDELLSNCKPERLFSIAEVYYTDGKPDGYVDSKRILDGLESAKALKWTAKKIKKAFKKPILDLDNFPQEWYRADNEQIHELFVKNIIKNEKNYGVSGASEDFKNTMLKRHEVSDTSTFPEYNPETAKKITKEGQKIIKQTLKKEKYFLNEYR